MELPAAAKIVADHRLTVVRRGDALIADSAKLIASSKPRDRRLLHSTKGCPRRTAQGISRQVGL